MALSCVGGNRSRGLLAKRTVAPNPAVFGPGHAYQGRAGIGKTTAAGLLLVLLGAAAREPLAGCGT